MMRYCLLALLASSALAVPVAPASAQGGGMAYAPGTSQYRVTSLMRQSSEIMGERQERQITTTQLVTVEIERGSPDTMHVHLVIDSAHVEPSGPGAVHRLVGVRLSGTMSPRGKIFELNPPEELTGEADVQAILLSMRQFLVALPASVRAGTVWTDTTDSVVETPEMDMSRRVIARSTLAGDTSYAGQRARRITQSVDVSVSGTASEQGQTVLISGIGTGSATYFVTNAGVYLGSHSEQETTMELSMGEMRMPLQQTMTSVVEKVR